MLRLRKTLLTAAVLGLLVSAARGQTPPPIVYPAGPYTITTAGPTTIVWTATSVTISWAGPAPVPIPVPPAPTPPPVPVLSGHVWALAIIDPAITLPAAQQAALTSSTLATSSLLLDVDFQPHPKTDAAVQTWLTHLPASGFPALILVQKDTTTGLGKLAYAGPLPASESEILALIGKVRGK